jgi:hypothetical protein
VKPGWLRVAATVVMLLIVYTSLANGVKQRRRYWPLIHLLRCDFPQSSRFWRALSL